MDSKGSRYAGAFRSHVRSLRVSRGLSQAQLDRAAGRKGTWTAKLESGALPAPDRATVIRLAELLGVDAAGLWREAALARLEVADAEALAVVLPAEQRGGDDLSDDEVRLVLALRRIDAAGDRTRGTTSAALLRLGNLVVTRDLAPAEGGPDARSLVVALDVLDAGSHRTARAALDVLVAFAEGVRAERDRLGFASSDEHAPGRRRRRTA
ncbi:MAG: helix-turn-helix domain-containing protein [Myxococcota bacterium]